VLATTLVRAAEVPAQGFEVVGEVEIGTSAGRVVNRRPVLRPITELRVL